MKPQEYTRQSAIYVSESEPEDTDPGEHQLKVLLKQTDGLLAENRRLRVELRMSRDKSVNFMLKAFPIIGMLQLFGVGYAAYNQSAAGAINITVSLLYMTSAVTYLFTRHKYEKIIR